MSQKSAFKAALAGKCPQCRRGRVFTHPLSRISKFARMNAQCSECSLHYEIEPGFFVGAMYFSYAVTVALLILIGLLHYLLDINELYKFITSVVVFNFLLLPFIFRYSRITFLYMFGGVKYKAE